MKSVAIDMVGQRYGRLIALHRVPSTRNTKAWWLFQCDCGRTIEVDGSRVRVGLTRSCGCRRDELTRQRVTTHGLKRTRAYASWSAAKTRCYNINVPAYADYGARGISMAPEWRDDFACFFAEMGECPVGYTIERIDNDKGYEPGNCRWATRLEQAQNKRTTVLITLNGRTLSISAWERELNFKEGTIKRRLQRGWSHLKALTAPVR